MHAFIVRPFGLKNGIDFDKIERELISPALERLSITGRTTADITRAGNIRADMIHLLLTADLVVADITIHNANVFYELGVRHALRDKKTFLLRASVDEVPFDLKTDRYLSYNAADPAASLPALIDGIARTLRAEVVDSPVYNMVPGLRPPDPAAFIVVPPDFREEVACARAEKRTGDLRFLASELTGFPWRREGMRVIGEAQFHLGDYAYAAETWEWVRNELPHDVMANLRLGTCYQKTKQLVPSDLALERVCEVDGLGTEHLAEARALLGSNAKTRWLADWQNRPDEATRQAEALRSPYLFDALQQYKDGFEAEPRHYYSGVNALAFVAILTELAAAQPDVWESRFSDSDEAAIRLRHYRDLRIQLVGAVEFSLRARQRELTLKKLTDPWLAISIADLAFLTGKHNTYQAYRDAFARLEPAAVGIAKRQFDIFQSLGILPKSVDMAVPLFPHTPAGNGAQKQPAVLVFTGHRIDEPRRPKPRFPAEREETARAAIRKAIQAEMSARAVPLIGLAGGASGGDLLFHEVCEELNIPRKLYLIIPRDEYVKASVAPAGPQWIERFNHQYTTAEMREYQRSAELPFWLQEKPDYGVWQRSNTWMLHNALAIGGAATTLLALWNGQGGDGPGGTEHMVKTAQARGARAIILDTNSIFGL
ncbi:conserved hypothetical protein [Candidatus Sulfopaludibacter sp. SbA4]|nr:conserved hypothetical protein [Candidatus Sulfopaludibacter sp. SbA4]